MRRSGGGARPTSPAAWRSRHGHRRTLPSRRGIDGAQRHRPDRPRYGCGTPRVFHGKPTSAVGFCAGAVLWALASLQLSEFSPMRMVLGAGVVAVYRGADRKRELVGAPQGLHDPGWPAIAIPMPWPRADAADHRRRCRAPGATPLATPDRRLHHRARALRRRYRVHHLPDGVRAHREGAQDSGRDRSAHRAVQPARFFRTVWAHDRAREAGVGRRSRLLLFDIDHFKSVNDRLVIRPVTILKLFANVLLHALRDRRYCRPDRR